MAKKLKEKLVRKGERNRYRDPDMVLGVLIRRIHIELTKEFGEIQKEEHHGRNYVMYPVEFDVSAITIPEDTWDLKEITSEDIHGVLYERMFEKDTDFIHWDIFSIIYERVIERSPDRHVIRSMLRLIGETPEEYVLAQILGLVSIKIELFDLVRRSGIEIVANYGTKVN